MVVNNAPNLDDSQLTSKILIKKKSYKPKPDIRLNRIKEVISS